MRARTLEGGWRRGGSSTSTHPQFDSGCSPHTPDRRAASASTRETAAFACAPWGPCPVRAPRSELGGSVGGVAKKAAIVGLVILILLLIIPLGIGAAMGMCPDCSTTGASGALTMCAVLVAVLLLAGSIFANRLGYLAVGVPALGVARTLERPPRSI